MNDTADTTAAEVNGDPSDTDIDMLVAPLDPDDDVAELLDEDPAAHDATDQ